MAMMSALNRPEISGADGVCLISPVGLTRMYCKQGKNE